MYSSKNKIDYIYLFFSVAVNVTFIIKVDEGANFFEIYLNEQKRNRTSLGR